MNLFRRRNRAGVTVTMLSVLALLYYNIIYVQLAAIDTRRHDNIVSPPNENTTDTTADLLRRVLISLDNNENLVDLSLLTVPIMRKYRAKREREFYRQCAAVQGVEHNGARVQVTSLIESLPFQVGHGGKTQTIFPGLQPLPFTQRLRVLLVPHSHCDPGWLDTYMSYYTKQVRPLLTNLYEFARDHTDFTYVYAEISFFKLWWEEQGEEVREGVRALLRERRFEIVQGGWVQADEANTHYFALFNEMLDGHDWISANLPEATPRTGWAIDPFGLSPTMGYVNKLFGLTGMHIDRVHYRVKTHLAMNKNIEFLWRQSWDDTGETDMLTHMNPFPGYNTENTCGPDRSVCEKFTFYTHNNRKVVKITEGNVKEMSELILSQWRKKAALHQTDTIFIELGDDFTYTKKEFVSDMYDNYTPIMNYINNEPALNTEVKWGIVTEYFDRVRAHYAGPMADQAPTLSGDFFTYADKDADYWSGYFTSRPFYKNLDRMLESALRRAEIFFSFSRLESSLEALVSARHALSLFQHHDGITGTSVRKVVDDYGNILYDAYRACNDITAQAVQHLLNHDSVSAPVMSRARFDDYDRYDVLLGESQVVMANSLSRDTETVRLLAVKTGTDLGIGGQIDQQIEPMIEYGSVVEDADYLVFHANVSSLSVQTLQLQPKPYIPVARLRLYNTIEKSKEAVKLSRFNPKFSTTDRCTNIVLGSEEGTSVTIDCLSGRMIAMRSAGGVMMSTDQEILLYDGDGGAYLFRPKGSPSTHLTPNTRPRITVIRGPVRHKAVVYIRDMVVLTYTVNMLTETEFVEVEVLTDLKDNGDLVVRFKTDVFNRGSIFTDNNGHTMQQHRYKPKLLLQGNFFPMPSTAFIQDSSRRFTVLGAEPHGVASLDNGYIEVVLDRRYTKTNDHRGLPEGIKDNLPSPARLRLLLEPHAVVEPQEGYTVEYPSLLSYRVLQTLQHPPYVGSRGGEQEGDSSLVESDHAPAYQELSLAESDRAPANQELSLAESDRTPANQELSSRQMMRELPVDEELVNLRFVEGRTSLLIRRILGFTCDISYPELCPRRHVLPLGDVFVDEVKTRDHPFSPLHGETQSETQPRRPMQFTSDYVTFSEKGDGRGKRDVV